MFKDTWHIVLSVISDSFNVVGRPSLMHAKDLTVTPMTLDLPGSVVLRTTSRDGKYACVTDTKRGHVSYVLDLVKGCR